MQADSRNFRITADGAFPMQSSNNRMRCFLPCILVCAASAAYGQTFYPSGGATRTVSGNATQTDSFGTWFNSVSDSDAGAATGYWSSAAYDITENPA